MRNWPYAYRESQRESSKVGGKVGVAILPRSMVAGGRHADVVGGFQLMVSNRSVHKDAAIELVRFLTSRQVQRFNAINRGYAPTRHFGTFLQELRRVDAEGGPDAVRTIRCPY